jgi:hypothetical protein
MTVDPSPLFDALAWLVKLGYALPLLPVQVVAIYELAESLQRLGEGLAGAVALIFVGLVIGVVVVGAIGMLMLAVVILCVARRDSQSV